MDKEAHGLLNSARMGWSIARFLSLCDPRQPPSDLRSVQAPNHNDPYRRPSREGPSRSLRPIRSGQVDRITGLILLFEQLGADVRRPDRLDTIHTDFLLDFL